MTPKETLNPEEMQESVDSRGREKILAGRVEETVTKFAEDGPMLAEKFSIAVENGHYDEAEQALESLLLQAKALGNTMHGKLDEFRDIMEKKHGKKEEEWSAPDKLAG